MGPARNYPLRPYRAALTVETVMSPAHSISSVRRRFGVALSLALVVSSIWTGPACAFICSKDEAPAQGHCHGESRAAHPGTDPAAQGCPKGTCARIQPASQTNRAAETLASQPSLQHASFAKTPSAFCAVPSSHDVHTLVTDVGLGPPVPPALFTVLRN